MKLIVISSPNKSNSELKHIINFFENGLEIFHIKKKGFTNAKMIEFINSIPRKYHERLVLHSHYHLAVKFSVRGIHKGSKRKFKFFSVIKFYYARFFGRSLRVSKSFNSIQSLTSDKGKYDYVLLSPIFDRHDMQEFSAAYSEKQLRNVLFKCQHNVIAFGGVKESRVNLARRTGFDGVAVHSDIWREKQNRLAKFIGLINAVKEAEKNIN
ncbi:MAG: thiamine phosphate synthase [Flavobacteriales bacterium]|nr:thiamine phosphate synthase [Flavobacteriales bacterium]